MASTEHCNSTITIAPLTAVLAAQVSRADKVFNSPQAPTITSVLIEAKVDQVPRRFACR